MTLLTDAPRNGTQAATDEWRHLSVQKFFSGFNWDDQPPPLQALQQVVVTTAIDEPLPMDPTQLTVSQFFGTYNWDGVAIAAPATSPATDSSATAAPDDVTLDDFFSLF